MDEKEVLEIIERAKTEGATTLDLSGKGLISVPEAIGQLADLQHLSLHNNYLTSLPDCMGQLTNLRWLSLHTNRLTSVPMSLQSLVNLSEVSFAQNGLVSIPDWLGELDGLRRLSLANNQLTSVPESLGQLTNLRRLYLGNNQLTSVPESLGQLANLQVLELDNNRLSSVPESLGQLTNLEGLFIDGNDLESPPPDVVEQGTQGVLAYLRELAKGARRRYEAKLLILGHGKEGKTCVSRALRGLPFEENIRTEGVEVVKWTFENPKCPTEADKQITLNIWDFEGQEINHQSHQFFLTENSLYLLVINGRRVFEMERAEYWLDTIRARAPQSRVILVASECENTMPSWPLDKLKANYADVLQGKRWYFVVGCALPKGIAELTQEIQSAAAGMEVMGANWPQSYDKAERAIRERAQREASISRTALYDVFRASGIADESLDAAAQRMATLGVTTQFTDSTDLADFVVLNPQWLTKGVSHVMEDEQLEQDKGEITRERMRAIWDERGYQGLYPTFHNCMKEFELCYDMEDKAGCLVPLRFGDIRPEISWSVVSGAKERRIEYKLDIRPPKGIMSRFIVKTHHMIAKTKAMPKGIYWRNGVFLRTGQEEYTSEALCEFDPEERTLRITVRAAFPQNMIEQLHGFAKAVFSFFEGLDAERRYGCVKFEPTEQQCQGVHAERRILYALSRKAEIDCDKGWHMVDPRDLVYGFSTFGEAALTVEELRHELDKRPAWAEGIIKDLSDCLIWIDKTHTEVLGVRKVQKMLPAEMRQKVEMGMREYLRMLSEMLDNRDFTAAPGVVSIMSVDKSPFNPMNWFEKEYTVTPYCESESGVHPADFGVSFRKPRGWWEKTAPRLALGVKVLSAGLQIAFAGLPLVMSEPLYKAMEKEVDFMKELAKHMELRGGAGYDGLTFQDEVRKDVYWYVPDLQEVSGEQAKRMARMQLAKLLEQIAPKEYTARQWGPLRRVPMRDNTYRWLCEEHAREYRR